MAYGQRGYKRRFKSRGTVGYKRRRATGLSRTTGIARRRYLRKSRKFAISRRGRRMRVTPAFRAKVRKVVCADSELKGTSFESYYADIVAAGANSWTREINNIDVQSCMAEVKDHIILGKSTSQASPLLADAVASKKVVAGDSQLKQREGGVIHPKRLDLMFFIDFGTSNTYFKCEWIKVRVWVVQSKPTTVASAVPAFNMWMAESAANEIACNWSDKKLSWFDPRKKAGTAGAAQFKVLKKVIYTIRADSVTKFTNMPFSDTNPLFGSIADKLIRFKSIHLKNAYPVKYTSDTSGDPDSSNLWLMVGAWNNVHSNARTQELPGLHLYSRLMYVENQCA